LVERGDPAAAGVLARAAEHALAQGDPERAVAALRLRGRQMYR
jgi:hypothetical protein